MGTVPVTFYEESDNLFEGLIKIMNRMLEKNAVVVTSITDDVTPTGYVPKKNDVEERVNQLEFELDKTKDILTQSLSRHTKEIDRLWDMIR
ncbi:MAG: hypothetical protein WC907_03245, partial [Acholeplasmataceae bacterium]